MVVMGSALGKFSPLIYSLYISYYRLESTCSALLYVVIWLTLSGLAIPVSVYMVEVVTFKKLRY